jgi:uncharacterized RDD family membrane protein YckC
MTGKGLRLIDFLIDSVIFFILLILLVFAFKDIIAIENIKWISGVLYFLYYFLFEYFSGQTIAKMITKSKVVSSTDRYNYYFIRIFIRSLTRLIPLDIISYIFVGRGLHDWISKTSVIKVTDDLNRNVVFDI